jgi:hypothetical protein
VSPAVKAPLSPAWTLQTSGRRPDVLTKLKSVLVLPEPASEDTLVGHIHGGGKPQDHDLSHSHEWTLVKSKRGTRATGQPSLAATSIRGNQRASPATRSRLLLPELKKVFCGKCFRSLPPIIKLPGATSLPAASTVWDMATSPDTANHRRPCSHGLASIPASVLQSPASTLALLSPLVPSTVESPSWSSLTSPQLPCLQRNPWMQMTAMSSTSRASDRLMARLRWLPPVP